MHQMFSDILLFMAIMATFSSGFADFPANLHKCQYGDELCLRDATTHILQQQSAELKDLNLLAIEPLRIVTMVAERDNTSAVNIELKFYNMDLFGFKSMHVKSLNGFTADMSGRNVIKCTVPLLHINGQYEVDGNVLIVPVEGEGTFEADMKNVELKFAFDFKPLKKNGKVYVGLEHVKLTLDPKHIHFQFDNLFNGNKLLGDNMNHFINDNWEDVYNEIKTSFTRSLSLAMKSVIGGFFEKYPYNEYFE